eukprot:403371333
MNTMEFINEGCILGVAYHMITFTDYQPDPDKQYDVGWVIIGITLFDMALNIFIMVYQTLKDLKYKLKRFYYNCKKKLKAKKKSKLDKKEPFSITNYSQDELIDDDNYAFSHKIDLKPQNNRFFGMLTQNLNLRNRKESTQYHLDQSQDILGVAYSLDQTNINELDMNYNDNEQKFYIQNQISDESIFQKTGFAQKFEVDLDFKKPLTPQYQSRLDFQSLYNKKIIGLPLQDQINDNMVTDMRDQRIILNNNNQDEHQIQRNNQQLIQINPRDSNDDFSYNFYNHT